MSSIIARYDRHARLYERHWAPVIAPTAVRVLDAPAARLPADGTGATVVDLGAGTGTLTRAAARRWPGARIIALDPASEMLTLAVAHARREGLIGVESVVAPAEAMPLPSAMVDLVVSSFALQLVPDRPAALREIRRVLRPGGALAYVTWLQRGEPFAPLEAFDEAVLDLGIEEPDEPEEPRAGDVASPHAATAQLRRSGFERCGARVLHLSHQWTPAAYLAYKLEYDEWALMAALSRGDRNRLERYARARFAALSEADFLWQADVVVAWGRAPVAVSRRA